MAETAALLAPEKTVLISDPEAGCSLANAVTAEELRAWNAEHPGAVVVSYVNTDADVKAAESDYCCTIVSRPLLSLFEHEDGALPALLEERAIGRPDLDERGPVALELLGSRLARAAAQLPASELHEHQRLRANVRRPRVGALEARVDVAHDVALAIAHVEQRHGPRLA